MQHRRRHILGLPNIQLRVGRDITTVVAGSLRVLWQGQAQVVINHVGVIAYEGVLKLPINIICLVILHVIKFEVGALALQDL